MRVLKMFELTEPTRNRLVITGGLGFIGSNIARSYVKSGEFDEIVLVDSLDRGSRKNIEDIEDEVEVIHADLSRSDEALECIMSADTVIHLAAVVGGIGLYENKPFSVAFQNSVIDSNVLFSSIFAGVNNFFYASTTHVYPHSLQLQPDSPPLKETDAELGGQFLSYGVEKMYIEKLLSWYHKEKDESDMRVAIARYCGIYGPNQDIDLENASLIPALCHRAAKYPEEPYSIRGDGKETRSYCYINDAVEATKMIINKMKTESESFVGPYNVGSDVKYTVKEIADLIAEVSEKGMETETRPEIKASILGQSCSLDKVKDELGWYPKTPFKKGLERFYHNVCERLNNEKKVSPDSQ
jgi:UDP-glucose 4-epimerase